MESLSGLTVVPRSASDIRESPTPSSPFRPSGIHIWEGDAGACSSAAEPPIDEDIIYAANPSTNNLEAGVNSRIEAGVEREEAVATDAHTPVSADPSADPDWFVLLSLLRFELSSVLRGCASPHIASCADGLQILVLSSASMTHLRISSLV